MSCKLLSPAGDINSGYAAIHYGADEVYLGLKQFSARALAHNFTEDELFIFTNYAKSKNVKVCLALNTLIKQKDIPYVIEALNTAKKAGVDAIIVQDLGVVEIIKTYFKEDFEIHASTQMAIHNLDGAKSAEKMGIKRIVLARELSLTEIENIVKNSSLETEVFIHGAMCYSYSGLCMFSALKNNASGNMGACQYSCREPYFENKLNFSMKDLWAGEDVLKLKEIGVTSLKIEGRRKNPLYVAAVTDYYRKILDGKDAHKESDNLKIIFSRGNRPFETDKPIDNGHSGHKGLLIGKVISSSKSSITFKTERAFGKYDGIKIESENQHDLFGFPVKEIKVNGKKVLNVNAKDVVEICFKENELKNQKIKKDDKVYLASESKIKSSFPYFVPKESSFAKKEQLSVNIEIYSGKVNAFTPYSSTTLLLDKSEKTLNPDKVLENAKKAFAKTHDIAFVVNEINLVNHENIYVSVADFNKIRNDLMDFEPHFNPVSQNEFEIPEIKIKDTERKKWILKTGDNLKKYRSIISRLDEIVVDLSSDFSFIPKEKVRIFMPTICRDDALIKKAKEYYDNGYKKFMIDNLYGFSALPQDVDLSSYYDLYCLNQFAYQGIPFTISPEDDEENISFLIKTFKDRAILPIIYNPPLFISGNKAFKEDEKDLGNYKYITKNNTYFVVEKDFTSREDMIKKLNPQSLMIDLTFSEIDLDYIKKLIGKE